MRAKVNPLVVASEIANEILANPGKYALRHRCVVKITSTWLWNLIVRSYGDDVSYARVSRNLIKILERNGYQLITVLRTRKKVYYFRPPRSICEQLREGRVKVKALVTQ